MKNITQVASKVAANPFLHSVDRADPKPLVDEGSARVINLLFTELKAVHPAWRAAWPTPKMEGAAKLSWSKAFTSAGLRSIEQIRYGIERCRESGSPFMPSVGQFLDWCRPTPENMGLPSVERAYLQACSISHPAADHSHVHPAVYHAACETGFFLLCNRAESKSRPVFERAYAMTIEMVALGEPLRELPKGLPAKATIPGNPEVGRSALAGLKRKVGGAIL